MTIVEFFATIAPLLILIPVIIGINRLHSATRNERNIIVLSVVAFLAQSVATILWWKEINNLFISHYFTIVEGALLLRYYACLFERVGRNTITFVAIGFVIFSLLQVIFSFPDLGINAASKGVESVLLIVMSFIVWKKIMSDFTEKNLLSLPLFWINSAVFVYFSAGLLLFLFSEAILAGKQSAGLALWAIHLFFMAVYYVLLGIGLWKISRK